MRIWIITTRVVVGEDCYYDKLERTAVCKTEEEAAEEFGKQKVMANKYLTTEGYPYGQDMPDANTWVAFQPEESTTCIVTKREVEE